MDAAVRFGWLTWRRFLTVGLAAVLLRAVIPSARAGQAFVVLVAAASVAAVWVGVSRLQPADRRPVLWFAIALSIYFAGDAFFYYYLLVLQSPRPFPSIADVLYLTDLPIFIGALLLFIRRQNPGRDVASLIDGAIVATACALVSWVYVIEPTVVSSTAPLLERGIGMAYPVLDVLLLTMAVRLLLIRGRRPPAHVLLTFGILALTLADGLYNFLNVLPGLPLDIEPYYVLWTVWYVLAATALLHPSVAAGMTPDHGSAVELDRSRLLLLAAVVLVAPTLLVIENLRGEHQHVRVIAAVSVALFVLVMSRMSLLMRSLREARKEAEAANEAKSAFLATMSHEMRTPLNAVIGLSDVLLESDLDQGQRSWVRTIVSSGRSLLGLIDDILDFSKIESGAMELASEPFAVRECVDSAIAILSPAAASRGLQIAYRADPDVPAVVRGDAARLRQVLVNLLSNAVKFTDAGGISLLVRPVPPEGSPAHVSTEPLGPGEFRLYFAVRDTGIGIPAAAQDTVFRAFFQAERSAARRHGGTGLGLAISRRLCELMGGTMWLESQEGLGSTFHFTVVAEPAGDALPAVRPAAPLPAGKGLRVLVAEDNPVNQEVIGLLLERLGHSQQVATNGHEVLRALEDGFYDVVLMDMQMPEMDGLEASRLIAERWPDRRPRIIAVTANALAGDREQCLASGMDDYLSKPFSMHELAEALAGLRVDGDDRP